MIRIPYILIVPSPIFVHVVEGDVYVPQYIWKEYNLIVIFIEVYKESKLLLAKFDNLFIDETINIELVKQYILVICIPNLVHQLIEDNHAEYEHSHGDYETAE